MYNLIKLQKHDAFYQSREGGKCSIKCFNADLQCHTTKAVEKISHSCPLTDSLTNAQDDSISELCSSLKINKTQNIGKTRHEAFTNPWGSP